MRKIILCLITMVFSVSCKSQKDNFKIYDCVNLKFNTSEFLDDKERKVDFFNLIRTIENELLKSGKLKAIDKNSYIEFLNDFNDIKKIELNKNFELILKNNGVSEIGEPNSLIYGCIRFFNFENQSESIINQLKVFDEIYSTDGDFNNENTKRLVEVVNNEDFENILLRAPIIMIICNNTQKLNR